MFKKLASIFIAATMLVSATAYAASAAEADTDSAVVGAEEDADSVAAEADGDATGASNVVNFDTKSANWNNFKNAYCYIWEYNDGEFFAWESKKTLMTDKDGDGVYTFDLDKAGISFDSGKEYAVIFSNSNGAQTYDLLIGEACIGDTAYCNGTTYENPVDSNKTGVAAFWKGQDDSKYGPVLTVTSIGNVVGTCLRPSMTKYGMFVSFLQNTLENARANAGKNDQQLLDDTAKALGLSQADIAKAVNETNVKVEWKSADGSTAEDSNASSTPESSNTSADSTKTDSKNTNNNNNNTSNNNTGNNTSSNNSSSNNSTNSVSSGQETTVLFVMGGVMLAAAGVFFLARKKREE